MYLHVFWEGKKISSQQLTKKYVFKVLNIWKSYMWTAEWRIIYAHIANKSTLSVIRPNTSLTSFKDNRKQFQCKYKILRKNYIFKWRMIIAVIFRTFIFPSPLPRPATRRGLYGKGESIPYNAYSRRIYSFNYSLFSFDSLWA